MSDEIYCAVDGCECEAEIEVEREGDILWLCQKHYVNFISLRDKKPGLNLWSDDELIDLLDHFRQEWHRRTKDD